MTKISLKAKDIEAALKKKGYEKAKNRSTDHKYYVLVINNIKQNVYTKISHGMKDVPSWLINEMTSQLKMPDINYLKDYVNCDIERDEYIQMLLDDGHINTEDIGTQ